MGHAIDKLDHLFSRLNALIAALVALSIGVFALLLPTDFLLRKLRLGGFEWLNEGAEYFLYFGVFLSAAWVLQKGAHVRVDIVIAALPHRGAVALERAMDLFGAGLCLVMTYYGIRGGYFAYVLGTLPDKDLRIPNWLILAVFSVSFALLAIEFLLRFYRAGRDGRLQDTEVGL
ncbi:MAG: TRAP transporter small permease [Pseudomonadota bacterium]